ncbi:hypothetical protein [Streptomyces sp. NPDC095613]|uniref:hypothetical protein n=1 Tax=Streptomyces sp. NPDC095613 TaxID=3155540 RepID=UPI00332FE046
MSALHDTGPVRAVGDLLLDRALAKAVVRVAAPGGIRFTDRQLYYEACRVLRPLGALPRRVPLSPAPPVRYESFTRALRRYEEWYGKVPGLLGPVPVPEPVPPLPSAPRQSAPDLYDYGLPRLLVCQNRAVARMLLANDVHLEAACPVLAADDLPLDPRLVAGLVRAGEGSGPGTGTGTVYVLHDADASGLALAARIRGELRQDAARDGGPAVRVSSLGLAPRHALALHLFSARGPRRQLGADDRLPAALTPRERGRLARGRTAEVEAVPPARLLRTVLRLVRGPRTPHHSAWTWPGLRDLRAAGFMTWPDDEPAGRTEDKVTSR